MAELPSPNEVIDLLSLLAPGLIISAIRQRVVSGSLPDYKDRLIAYGIISVGYFAAITPLFHIDSGWLLPAWLWTLLQYFVIPTALGIGAAYLYRFKIVSRIAKAIGLQLAHPLPAAWDYTFEAIPAGTFVLVTMTDGTQIPGQMGPNSFASSSKEERDLLIEELWQIDAGGLWSPLTPRRNVLLCGKDIRLIEIF